MTVIAWDGKTLSSDRMCTIYNIMCETTKIFKRKCTLVGAAGESPITEQFVDFILYGGDKPDVLTSLQGIKVTKRGVFYYCESTIPTKIDQKQFAIGVGAEAAMMAMMCGKTSREAVELTSKLISGCGLGVDSLTLQDS